MPFCESVGNVVDSFMGHKYESFADAVRPKMTTGQLVALVLYVALVLFAGKYLWDNVLCKVVTICKPMPSVLHLVGLILILDLVLPSCKCVCSC